jgi:hypothetical protein
MDKEQLNLTYYSMKHILNSQKILATCALPAVFAWVGMS